MSKTMTMNEASNKLKDACGYGKMGRTKLYEEINNGEIIAYTRDGRTLVDLDSVDAMNGRELKPWRPGA